MTKHVMFHLISECYYIDGWFQFRTGGEDNGNAERLVLLRLVLLRTLRDCLEKVTE